MARTYVNWGCWDELSKETDIKRKPKVANKKNEDGKIKKRKQFARCPKCGGQMTYVPETNILLCENEVQKKFSKKNEDGATTEETKTVICGYINLVDKKYLGYMNYLFQM